MSASRSKQAMVTGCEQLTGWFVLLPRDLIHVTLDRRASTSAWLM